MASPAPAAVDQPSAKQWGPNHEQASESEPQLLLPMNRTSTRLITSRKLWIAVLAMVDMTLAGMHAGTLHVAPGGDDADAGTLDSPFRTLQKAA